MTSTYYYKSWVFHELILHFYCFQLAFNLTQELNQQEYQNDLNDLNDNDLSDDEVEPYTNVVVQRKLDHGPGYQEPGDQDDPPSDTSMSSPLRGTKFFIGTAENRENYVRNNYVISIFFLLKFSTYAGWS